MKRFCIFGGQFGSEGKGHVAEWLIKEQRIQDDGLVVMGCNSPNNGHTNSQLNTQSIPVSSLYADVIFLGPESVVDERLLCLDLDKLKELGNSNLKVFIHENAAVKIGPYDSEYEKSDGLETRLGSTCSGSGSARYRKYYFREKTTVRNLPIPHKRVFSLNSKDYIEKLNEYKEYNWLFEMGHGVLLDPNWGDNY